MSTIDCTLLSPVHIQEKTNFLIPPIVFAKKIYLVKEKKFFELLMRIGLFQDFNQNIRENGYEYTSKWLYSKDLMNEGFLENISQYWINDVDIRKLTNYRTFLKDVNSNPTISTSYIRNLFKKALIYRYIQNNKDKFNEVVSKELDFINQELSLIKDITIHSSKQNIYRKNLFKVLLENFLTNIDARLAEKLQITENIIISLDTNLSLVCELNFGSGNLTDKTHINPSRISSPVVSIFAFLAISFSSI